jgi:Rad3-related DNA helicase
MSATINEHDIRDLGLDNRRVVYIECDSPIPPANRPVVVLPTAKVNYENQDAAVPLLAEQIRKLLEKHQDSGVIHCTYELAEKIKVLLKDEPRLLWHNKYDRDAKYAEYLREAGGGGSKVLVCSGMYEGIDLSYDLARWQVICKVPFPSLADSVVNERLARRPDSYAWSAIRDVLQATGRVCRTPTDKGVTYILDNSFETVWNRWPDLFPGWFRQAVRKS